MSCDPLNKKEIGFVIRDRHFHSGRIALREGTNVVIEYNRNDARLIYAWDEFETNMLLTFFSEAELLSTVKLGEHRPKQEPVKREKKSNEKITFEL